MKKRRKKWKLTRPGPIEELFPLTRKHVLDLLEAIDYRIASLGEQDSQRGRLQTLIRRIEQRANKIDPTFSMCRRIVSKPYVRN